MVANRAGHYRIVERLAAGGMGVVYRAEDVRLSRAVALKFLTPDTAADEEYRARFVREARVAAALNHPNVCTVYEVGEATADAWVDGPEAGPAVGTPFIAMEFIEGETLAAWISRVGHLTTLEAIDASLQIAEGLSEAHSKGIVHRDLKPQNVMVSRAGRVKIVDFGLAKPIARAIRAGTLVRTSEMISADLGGGTLLGTCAYMSPEQALGKPLDARSDVFAFGTLLYQMLSGRLPFQGDTSTEVLAKILEAAPEALLDSDIGGSSALKRVIWRCLEKRAADRYQDMRDVAGDLREARRRLAPGEDGMAGLWMKRLHPKSMTAVAFALLALTMLTYLLGATREDPGGAQSGPDATLSSASSLPAGIVAQTKTPLAPAADTTSSRADPPSAPDGPAVTRVSGSSAVPSALPDGVPGKKAENRATTTPPVETSGTLSVSSVPRSSISIDGILVGVTPLTLQALPGTHVVTLATSEGLRWRGRLEVRTGETTILERDLGATGALTIVADAWAEVTLDQGPLEQTPVHFPSISAGLHQLRGSRAGYVTEEWEVVIEEGRTTRFKVVLVKKP